MPSRHFDQASRYAAKLDAVGLLSWLLRETADELRFRAWLDTRTLPWPGDPERTCDTVAWLGDADPAVEWAVPVEFSLEPDAPWSSPMPPTAMTCGEKPRRVLT